MLIQFTYCIQLGINPVQPERKHFLNEAIYFWGARSFHYFGRKVEILCQMGQILINFPIIIVYCIHLSRTKSIVSPFGHRTDSLTIVSLVVVLMIMEQYCDIMFLDYYKSPSALSARA